ncbi:hypothetical protein PINS_up007060 [Pythium insidiosum]|nr:hypothetical protein PINS_up007060 [Pythium insidiosum]
MAGLHVAQESALGTLKLNKAAVVPTLVDAVTTPRIASSSWVVRLSPRAFAVVWTLLIGLHTLSLAHAVLVLYVYHYLVVQQLESTMTYLGADVHQLYPAVVVCYALLSMAHTAAILPAVVDSIHQRQFVFSAPLSSSSSSAWSLVALWRRPSRRVADAIRRSVHSLASTATASTAVQPSCSLLSCPQRVFGACYAVFFGSTGLFGIGYRHFDLVFRLMEIVEIACQTYQAWKLSHLVATVWINRLVAVIIAVNCVSTPLLHRLLPHRAMRRRILSLLLDVVLDFVMITVVPIAIFKPYLDAFDPALSDFPLVLYYDDTWFTRAVAENQQVFFTSATDLASKFLPSCMLFICLLSLRECFAELAPGEHSRSQSRSRSRRKSSTTEHQLIKRMQKPRCHRRLHVVLDVVIVAFSILVLAAHLHVTSVADGAELRGCFLSIRPWFVSVYNCAVLEVNCALQGHRGDVESLTRALQPVDSFTLHALVLSSCDSLEMPPILQRFERLQMLKLFNVTLRRWGSEAALTATMHPTIQLVYIAMTNFSVFPDGLLHPDFPPTLRDIEFTATNLTTLPSDVQHRWSVVQFFVLEQSPGITHIPPELLSLRIPQFSLCSNAIAQIPDETLELQSFWTLGLAGKSDQAASCDDWTCGKFVSLSFGIHNCWTFYPNGWSMARLAEEAASPSRSMQQSTSVVLRCATAMITAIAAWQRRLTRLKNEASRSDARPTPSKMLGSSTRLTKNGAGEPRSSRRFEL